VIIDDDFLHVGGENPYPATLASAQGLFATFMHASELDDTRSVGFFLLPPTNELLEEQLLPDLLAWLKEVSSGDTRLYFLIDVFYGAGTEYEVGPMVLKRLKPAYPDAKFAFISQAGWSGLEEPSGPLVKPNVFAKGLIEVESKFRNKLPDDLLQWLDALDRSHRASNWDLPTWRRLREAAKAMCESLGNERYGDGDVQGDGLWAHHLPFGGSRWPASSDLYERKIVDWTGTLRRGLLDVAPEIESFPDHGWAFGVEGGVPGWERPPIRALAQFDNMGRDLTTAFYLAEKDVRRISQSEIKVRFASSLTIEPYNLKRDYLWFNVSAIASGLFIIAKNFYDEIREIHEGTSNPTDLPVPCVGGRIFWSVQEFDERGKLGIRIRVHQNVLGWSVNVDEDHPSLVTHSYGFPEVDRAKKKMKDAYGCFNQSGATVQVDGESLVLEVRAKNVGSIWELAD
jgi:hypothetical protein